MRKRLITGLVFLVIAALSCRSLSPPASVYANADFSVNIPAGWAWSVGDGKSPYGLAFKPIVAVSHPVVLPNAAFSVTTAPLGGATSLESLFEKTYEGYSMQALDKQKWEHNGLAGYEISYVHNLGEGWWQYHDIWLQRGALAYVLSFSSARGAQEYTSTFDQILDSLQFKE
jgi:hypothetical protein